MTCGSYTTGRRCGYCDSGTPHPEHPVTEQAADEIRAVLRILGERVTDLERLVDNLRRQMRARR